MIYTSGRFHFSKIRIRNRGLRNCLSGCIVCHTGRRYAGWERRYYGSLRKAVHAPQKERAVPGAAGGAAGGVPAGHLQVGVRSFPKLKIPHQSHADFCSTDTAGGLDNKKRRYAPRGGVAYRLFLWGFPKGATPPFGTRLCEAKCSVLYALPALP